MLIAHQKYKKLIIDYFYICAMTFSLILSA